MSNTSTVTSEMVRSLRSGSGPLARLSRKDICDIVATFAPYGEGAREAYFAELREAADSAFPTYEAVERERRSSRTQEAEQANMEAGLSPEGFQRA